MSQLFNPDSPVSSAKDDKFHRAPFAGKICSICGHSTPSSTVVGVYGKWGEGKSSLLNMVSEKLDPEILQIRFNPWYFKDQDDLLLAFLKVLAQGLGRKLNTKKEQIQNAIAKYGELLGAIEAVPKVGKAAAPLKATAKLFKAKELSPEEAKGRINEFIIESRLDIVIFIDDLDRLDSREVQTIFKLVKLLCDFPRTTYILFFDPDIVARMLAPAYGGIVPDSGHQFLEKVIQIPLVIPKAHEDEIVYFIQGAIKRVTSFVNINLESEKEVIAEILVDGLLLMLNNPRKIVRFSNSFQFSLLILHGEVNVVDLIVLETFKSNFHDYYRFIRDNKELFLTDYTDENVRQYMNNHEQAQKQANKVLENYTESVRSTIRNLTLYLFPQFAWVDLAEAKSVKMTELARQKKVSSKEYFDRYFTFSIRNDEMPDTEFNRNYIQGANLSAQELADQLARDISKYSLDNVASKFVFNRNDINPANRENVIQAICLMSNELKEREGFDFTSPFTFLAMSISSMIKSMPNERRLPVALEAVRLSKNLLFSAELTARFAMPSSPQDRDVLFTGNDAVEIKKMYLGRLFVLIIQHGFFNAIPEQYMVRQLMWWHDVNPNDLDINIRTVMMNDYDAARKLLRIFTPTLHKSSSTDQKTRLIKANFHDTEYERLDKIVGADEIYRKLTYRYGDLSDLPTVHSKGLNDELDDETLIGKFQEMYKLRNPPEDDGSGLLRKDE